MGYSRDERGAAVSGLVQGTLSFPVNRLGVRDQTTPFEEVRELANSALLYDPDAVFYVIWQAAKALGNSVKAEVQLCEDLLAVIDDLAMPNKPIEDVSSVSDAATALTVMQGALVRKGVIGASEYSRYNAAVGRATKEISRTAKMTYVPRNGIQVIKDVVRSSSEAKTETLSVFKNLKESHSDLINRVGYILESYSQFLAANLSGIVGQRQLSRAASEMRALHDDLNPKTPMQRTATARASLLTVLANKSVVRALKSRVLPGQARVSQGSPQQYRLSAAGTGTPAKIQGMISAPWAIQGSFSDRLRGVYNGTLVTVDLVDGSDSGIEGIKLAQVDGFQTGDFAVSGDISTPYPLVSNTQNYMVPTDGIFQIRVDGVLYECALTSGAGRTAANILTDLTTPANWVSPPGVPPVTFSATTKIKATYNNGSPPDSYAEREMEVVQGFLATPLLWPWSADVPSVGLVTANRTFGWNANNELWIHPNDYDDFVSNPIVATLPNGSFPNFLITATQVKTAIDAAATASSEEFEGIVTDDRISVVSTWSRIVNGSSVVGGEGSYIAVKSDGMRTSGGRTGFGTPSYLGIQTLGFSDGQESQEHDVGGQTVVKALNQNVGFNAQVKASLVKETYFESTEGVWSAGGVLLKLESSDPTVGWPPASQLKVSIRSGGNRGFYGVTSYSWSNIGGYDFLVLTLDRRMRSEEPSTYQHFEVYSEFIKIESLVDTTVSKIDIDDPVTIPPSTARKVLGLSSSAYYGSSAKMLVEWNDPQVGWKPADIRSRKIKVGDKVVQNGSEVTTISGISELESGLVSVDPEVVNWTTYNSFSIGSADYLMYKTFIDGLELWWEGFQYQEDLDSLDRMINTILRSHPNNDRVSAVYGAVVDLRDALTGAGSVQELIDEFSVRPIASVKAATKSFADRGLDRARELLLQGRFEEFFLTTSRTASHGSAFLDSAAKAVVQDLNEANLAKARFSAVYRRRVGDWREDTDPTSDFSDTEEELPDDELEEYWPGVDEELYGEH